MSQSEPDVVESGEPAAEDELRLYTPLEVTLASLLGGPLAGAALLAGNQKRTQRKTGRTLWLGLAGMLVYVYVLWWAPTSSLRGVVVAVQTVVMYGVAGFVSSRMLKAMDLDDLPASPPTWHAAAAGVAGMALVIAGTVLLDRVNHWQIGDNGMRRVMISPKEDVIYWGKEHETQAQDVGQALLDEGFFTGKSDRTAMVGVNEKGEHVVSVMAGADFMAPKMEAELKKIGASVRSAVGRGPVVVRALDAGFEEKSRTEVQ